MKRLMKFYPNNKEERDFAFEGADKKDLKNQKKKTRAKDERESKENSRASRRDLNDFRQRNF